MQQALGEDMATIRVGAKLDFIHRDKIRRHPRRHRLNGAYIIPRFGGDNSLFAGQQRHRALPAQLHQLFIDLARQKPQRQADDAGLMAKHALDSIMGFSGVGRAKHRCNFAHFLPR